MAGNKIGGKKTAETNIKKYGRDFYAKIGKIGGSKGCTGGFASYKVGADGLNGRQRACVAGALGGTISRKKGKDL